jgi:hypothetical protein
MKTKTSNQNTSTSPRFKRRGLIYLGLLCILGILMAPIQSFAQDAINVDATRRLTPQQFESVVNAIVPQIAPKFGQINPRRIQTRWENVNATPSWVSIAKGGNVYLSGRLMRRNPNGSYSPMANEQVAIVFPDGRVVWKATDRNGSVQSWVSFAPRPGIYRPGQSVQLYFGCYYPGNPTFAPSKQLWSFTLRS